MEMFVYNISHPGIVIPQLSETTIVFVHLKFKEGPHVTSIPIYDFECIKRGLDFLGSDDRLCGACKRRLPCSRPLLQ